VNPGAPSGIGFACAQKLELSNSEATTNMSDERDEIGKVSQLEQVDEAWNFPLFDAIMNRRSRRFGLGMEIEEGPNKFKSPNEPVPLDEVEESLLIAAGTGISGLNLGDLQ